MLASMLIRRAGVRVVGSRTAVASMRRALSAADRSQPPSQQSPSQQSQPPQTPQQRQLNMLDSFNMLSPDIGKTHVGGIGRGVLVVNGVRVHHSVVLLPRGYLHWHVAHMGQLTLESLALFTLLDPPVEVLVVGTGATFQPISPELRFELRKRGVVLEVMSSRNAISTFNILNEEDRHVAAAIMLPRQHEKVFTDDEDN